MKFSKMFWPLAAGLVTFSTSGEYSGLCKAAPKKLRTQTNAKIIARGKGLFTDNQCLDCHKLAGKGAIEGIELDGVGSIRSTEFLRGQLEDPEKHVKETLHNNSNMMVAPNLSKDEVRAIVAYLKTLKKPPSKSVRRRP